MISSVQAKRQDIFFTLQESGFACVSEGNSISASEAEELKQEGK